MFLCIFNIREIVCNDGFAAGRKIVRNLESDRLFSFQSSSALYRHYLTSVLGNPGISIIRENIS